jgi:alkaline phosphatase D
MEQEAWLFDSFKRSDTAWNVIAQEQLVAQLRQRTREGGLGFWTDGWDGFPLARRRMLEAVAGARVANPVFIGGDIHSYWVTDLKADFDNVASPVVATEFVGTSVTSDPPRYDLFQGFLPDNPHVKYFESRERGYVSVELTRARMEVRLRKTSERRDPKANVSTLRTYVVENGRPGAVSA